MEIQLTIAINSISSKDNDEERVMHSNSDNIEIMNNDRAVYQSLLSRYQIGFETLMRDSDFIFDCVYLLYYKCHKINFKSVGSYIDSTDSIKNKKAKIINKKDN